MRAVLGIDTSAYTTSCALVDEGCGLIESRRRLLPVAKGERGLRQSEAVFCHLKQLPELLQEIMEARAVSIEAVCVSEKPVDAERSYMPVFQVGLSFARALAAALNTPCCLTTHQRGHLAAAGMGQKDLPDPHLAMHLSGGTTELLRVDGEEISVLGRSLDLHMGQLIDRLGVRMGLAFPAGPQVELLAAGASPAGRYKVSLSGTDCHLSGVEAQAMRDLDEGSLPHQQVAAELFDALQRTIRAMLLRAGAETGIRDALLFGGIASSSLLRRMLETGLRENEERIRLRFGLPELSGDNAVGVALIGARKHFGIRRTGGGDGNTA